jgi:hypothetical protein
MNKTFRDYNQAKEYARQLASMGGPDAGIGKTYEFRMKVFEVKFLPKPENCFGHELTMERVRAGD